MQQEIHEAVCVFSDQRKLDEAVAELEVTAFPRHDISVLGSERDMLERYGADAVDPAVLEDSPQTPRGISVRPEEKTIIASVFVGFCAYAAGCAAALAAQDASGAALLGAIAGGSFVGTLAGLLVVWVLATRLKNRTERQISKGGLVLWVRTPGPEEEKIAQDIMHRHGGRHVHIHNA